MSTNLGAIHNDESGIASLFGCLNNGDDLMLARPTIGAVSYLDGIVHFAFSTQYTANCNTFPPWLGEVFKPIVARQAEDIERCFSRRSMT